MTGANKKGLRKRKKTYFRKGTRPHNTGTSHKHQELSNSETTHYIRPSTSELDMAAQDPIRPHGGTQQEDADNSVMVLRPKRDLPLEVEKKNFGIIDGR